MSHGLFLNLHYIALHWSFPDIQLSCKESLSSLILHGPFSSTSLVSTTSRTPCLAAARLCQGSLSAGRTAELPAPAGRASSPCALCPRAPTATPGPACCPHGGPAGPRALQGLLRGHLPAAFPCLPGPSPDLPRAVYRGLQGQRQAQRLPLTHGGLRLPMCNKFLALRPLRARPTLPTAAVAAPALAGIPGARLDGAWSNPA